MYIKYRAIFPSRGAEVLEMAEMVGITRSPASGFVILTLSEGYMDVYFKMSNDDYEKMIEEMCENLRNGKNVYAIKPVGIMNDTSYFKGSDLISSMNSMFGKIRFRE